MLDKFKKLIYLNSYDFQGNHKYLEKRHINKLNKLIQTEDQKIIKIYEKNFSKLIGRGRAVTYASGRMGLYEILNYLNISKNDEVIVNAGTCSVVVNAILKVGGKPVFSDVDIKTYGSSAKSISQKISRNTKLIIAQHSFGIPCEIKKIKKISNKKKIFLLEDCALSLGSKVNKNFLGNFGEASLFSTDHTKPINTFCGGVIYSNNKKLIKYLQTKKKKIKSFSVRKKKNILNYIFFKNNYSSTNSRLKKIYLNLSNKISIKFFNKNPYLDCDYYSKSLNGDYPYPCKFPSFLAFIGILEIKRWKKTKVNRKIVLNYFLDNLSSKYPYLKKKLPIYKNKNYDIVPLRLAWHDPRSRKILLKVSNLIDISGIWFKKPIEATNSNLSSFYYKKKSCKISEKIGSKMINLPCNIDFVDAKKITSKFIN